MVSVCMAAYNGERYIKKQIESIMDNLTQEDELIISDDFSTDNTRKIIDDLSKEYSNIRLIDGPKAGVKKNFENALSNAIGDYLFLCDQDDIWEPTKVKDVLEVFNKTNASVVVHDAEVFNEKNEVTIPSFIEYRGSKNGALKNIVKNSYIGCCMAFKKELLEYVLPIPNYIEMHDQWIGVLGDMHGGSYFYKKVLFHYRRHGDNVSSMSHYGVGKMIKNRVFFVWALLMRSFRGKRKNK